MTDETAHIACAAAVLDDEYAALNRHLHGDGDTRDVRMTIDTAKLRDETLAMIAQEDCDWCVDGLQADGETPCSCRLGATSPAADTLRLLDEIDRLRAENERLRADMSSGSFYQEKDIDAMQDEIERLRAELERSEIADAMAGKAARDIVLERMRQINVEGWFPEIDDEQRLGELAAAAACYCHPEPCMDDTKGVPFSWPWQRRWWKPTTRRRDLVKAGALILAEIERIDRAERRALEGDAA